MAKGGGWLDRLIGQLATPAFLEFVARHILVPFWAWWTPVARRKGGPPFATQPSENVQRMMNLVLPLKDKTAVGRAKAALAIGQHLDELFAGLDNVGTVHFARFAIVGNNLCMFSEYDGDFSNYIRDFIVQMGKTFDAIVRLIEGGNAVIPTEHNIQDFIDWVRDHDMYQLPDLPTDILRYGNHDDLRLLPRALILQLNVNRNVLLGSYRAYPGFSSAQIRRQLGMGR